jgi:cytoskeletal protein RodZ
MDPIEKHERKRQAWQRLRAQKRRAGQLRGRVVAISLIGFALLWATVFVQMATGNDPVLGSKSSKVASSQPAKGSARQSEAEAVEPEPVESEPVEVEPEVEAEPEAEGGGEAAEVEAEELEALEAEIAEQEAAEFEAAEVEPEPAPVTTSQS